MVNQANGIASSIGDRRLVRMVLVLAVIGLCLRLGAMVVLKSWRFPNVIEHSFIAQSVLAGEGFRFIEFEHAGPSSVQSPTYPLFLAGLYRLFGIESPAAFAAAMAVNSLLGGLTVVLTYHLARTLGGSARVGILAAAAFAIWPTQIYSCTHVQAISMITAGLAAVLILFYRSIRTTRVGSWVALSVIGCLSALTEPALLPPMALTGLMILFWPKLPVLVRLRNAAILLACAIFIIGPWTIRNRLVHGTWVPIKATFWVNVWKGNNDYATGTDRLAITEEQLATLRQANLADRDLLARDRGFDAARQYDMLTPEQLQRLLGRTEIEREMVFKEWAVRWIRSHPGRYLELCGLRLIKTVWLDWDNPKSRNLVYMATRSILLTLSSIGLVIAVRRKWSLLYPAVFVVTCLAVYTMTVTAARFSIPFEPLQFCLAALAVVSTVSRQETPGMTRTAEIDR